MKFDYTLEFNDQWYDQLIAKLTEFVDMWSSLIADTADADVRYYPELKGAIKYEVSQVVGEIVGEIFPDDSVAWMAWLEEFGRGSEMDASGGNPYLVDYVTSEYWNPDRQGLAITGWGETHTGIDGQTYTVSPHAPLKGQNLEKLQRNSPEFAEWADEKGLDFQPTPPNYFMRNALDVWRNNIIEDLNQVVAEHLGNLFL